MKINKYKIEDTKISNLYKEVLIINNRVINEFKEVYPYCFVLHKNNELDIISLAGQDLNIVRKSLIDYITQNRIKGYILILEGKINNQYCVIRSIYTPKHSSISLFISSLLLSSLLYIFINSLNILILSIIKPPQ